MSLENILKKIDGKGYKSYEEIEGVYEYPHFRLSIDHVQKDPFAAPSRLRIIMAEKEHGLPRTLWDTAIKRVAVSDFLTRTFRENIMKYYTKVGGSGKSGVLEIDDCGQQMIERTSVMIDEQTIEVRLQAGLPAAGRKVLGHSAIQMLVKALTQIVEQSLIYKNINGEALKRQVELIQDQEYIRKELKKRKLIAFVANGAILPRENGISERPLKAGAVPFKSPKSLEVTMNLPYFGEIKGMGLSEGITLIVGGGYHGKSTLLRALELGVYNHIEGDGREYVITDHDAVKVRAEDGRSVEKVNISSFINNLPNHKDTVRFTTQNASGSTSQAANTIEAIEAGTSCLLIDEDTSATNFMIRDSRMQQLVKKEKEPITPFIQKVKPLYKEYGISTILAVGGSGEYFDVADYVIMMDEYQVKDVTDEAKAISKAYGEKEIDLEPFGKITKRIPLKKSFISQERGGIRIKTRSKECIGVDKSDINLNFAEQLTDYYQTNGLAAMLEYLIKKKVDDQTTLKEMIDRLYEEIEKQGLGIIIKNTRVSGNIVLPRKQELFAAINRYRMLKIN